jgi:UDP-N-acetylmuramoyl-tripeptide--D-alanyl-D-alanine ligase
MNLKNIDGIFFIDDTYNSNPTSFRAALESLKSFKIREKKGVICGDMLELGPKAEELHREIGATIAEHVVDFVIAVGPLSEKLADEAVKRGYDAKKIQLVKDSEEAGKACKKIATAGDFILVKGSRGMRMEKVFECYTTCSTR